MEIGDFYTADQGLQPLNSRRNRSNIYRDPRLGFDTRYRKQGFFRASCSFSRLLEDSVLKLVLKGNPSYEQRIQGLQQEGRRFESRERACRWFYLSRLILFCNWKLDLEVRLLSP